jgi:truncated hemoglobin YjbI
MKTRQEHLKTQIGCLTSHTDINQEKADAWLEEMKAWLKETTACQEAMEAYLEKAKASLEEMEATVNVFKEGLNKMDTMDLAANRENLGSHGSASGSP